MSHGITSLTPAPGHPGHSPPARPCAPPAPRSTGQNWRQSRPPLLTQRNYRHPLTLRSPKAYITLRTPYGNLDLFPIVNLVSVVLVPCFHDQSRQRSPGARNSCCFLRISFLWLSFFHSDSHCCCRHIYICEKIAKEDCVLLHRSCFYVAVPVSQATRQGTLECEHIRNARINVSALLTTALRLDNPKHDVPKELEFGQILILFNESLQLFSVLNFHVSDVKRKASALFAQGFTAFLLPHPMK